MITEVYTGGIQFIIIYDIFSNRHGSVLDNTDWIPQTMVIICQLLFLYELEPGVRYSTCGYYGYHLYWRKSHWLQDIPRQGIRRKSLSNCHDSVQPHDDIDLQAPKLCDPTFEYSVGIARNAGYE